jgi:type I restriction enzyme, S subunit
VTTAVAEVPLRFLMQEIDERAGDKADVLPLLSVSVETGVGRRKLGNEGQAPSEDISHYKLCWPGDLVLNKLRAFQGGVGVAEEAGLVSPAYSVLRFDREACHPRFVHYLARSAWFVGQMTAKLRGIGSPSVLNARTPHVNVSNLGRIRVPLPQLETQRRIAEMLDVETARIDTLITKNHRVITGLDARVLSHATELICARGDGQSPSTHPSAFWIRKVPESWAVAALGLRYEVQLGKMLSAERRESGDQRPYLANVDVQWDRFNTSDLRTMDFADDEWKRYGVEPGDVLICEGGEIGRAAVWPEDGPSGIHYQKALHRARPLNPTADNPRWLYYALYVAAKTGVFQFGAESSTIDHLTGERLREHRFPFPPRSTQNDLVAELDATLTTVDGLKEKVERQNELLRLRRQALITAAVTGQIDV